MKNKNEISGNINVNNIIQSENGNIIFQDSLNQKSGYYHIPTAKEKIIKTGITPVFAAIIAVIALVADFTSSYLNLKQILHGNTNLSMFTVIILGAIAFFSFAIFIVARKLISKGFSTIFPVTQFHSKFVLSLDEEGKVLITKLKMTCPKCNSVITIGNYTDGYYAMCKRNSDHNLKFDYTTLDDID